MFIFRTSVYKFSIIFDDTSVKWSLSVKPIKHASEYGFFKRKW